MLYDVISQLKDKREGGGGGGTPNGVWGPCELDLALGEWISKGTNKEMSAQFLQCLLWTPSVFLIRLGLCGAGLSRHTFPNCGLRGGFL